jgi:hypothetical protein
MWNWNYYGYENVLATIETWLASRVPSLWWRYRTESLEDLRHPILAPITLLMPWTWIMRDLHVLRGKAADIGPLKQVATLAGNILFRVGMKPAGIAAFLKHLGALAENLEPNKTDREPLRPDIARQIAGAALASIPDINYWTVCNAEMERSPDFQIA